jgi:hypothetical protein
MKWKWSLERLVFELSTTTKRAVPVKQLALPTDAAQHRCCGFQGQLLLTGVGVEKSIFTKIAGILGILRPVISMCRFFRSSLLLTSSLFNQRAIRKTLAKTRNKG